MSIIRAIEQCYIQKEKRGWDRLYFLFDVHGTIIKPNYQYGNIPTEFYPYSKETLQYLSSIPEICMILYTCSHQHEINQYLELFKENGIRFDYVNENPEVLTDKNGYGCYDKKPYVNILFEDKAGFLGEEYNVTNITQNVDDLHERAGSSNIIHLHGELTKARGCMYNHKQTQFDQIYDIGYNDIKLGDKCKVTGSQLRPHIVWFGEFPFGVIDAYAAVYKADILLIIGTSLQISYTLDMLTNVRRLNPPCEIYYIDPNPMHYLDNYGLKVNYIEKTAVEGVCELVNKLVSL